MGCLYFGNFFYFALQSKDNKGLNYKKLKALLNPKIIVAIKLCFKEKFLENYEFN